MKQLSPNAESEKADSMFYTL